MRRAPHPSTDANLGKSIRDRRRLRRRVGRAPALVENRPRSAPIRRGDGKPVHNIVGPEHYWVATPARGRTLRAPLRIGGEQNKRIIPAPSALPANLERAQERGR